MSSDKLMARSVLEVAIYTKVHIRYDIMSGTLQHPATLSSCRWQKSQILLYVQRERGMSTCLCVKNRHKKFNGSIETVYVDYTVWKEFYKQ
jgi:hypothetical protein